MISLLFKVFAYALFVFELFVPLPLHTKWECWLRYTFPSFVPAPAHRMPPTGGEASASGGRNQSIARVWTKAGRSRRSCGTSLPGKLQLRTEQEVFDLASTPQHCHVCHVCFLSKPAAAEDTPEHSDGLINTHVSPSSCFLFAPKCLCCSART